jgi:hypothetical protein
MVSLEEKKLLCKLDLLFQQLDIFTSTILILISYAINMSLENYSINFSHLILIASFRLFV